MTFLPQFSPESALATPFNSQNPKVGTRRMKKHPWCRRRSGLRLRNLKMHKSMGPKMNLKVLSELSDEVVKLLSIISEKLW